MSACTSVTRSDPTTHCCNTTTPRSLQRGQEYETHLSKALDQKELPTEGKLHDLAARARCLILYLYKTERTG